jgi:hypothetical protein
MAFEQAPIIIVCGSTRPKPSKLLDKVGVLGKGKTDFSLYLAEKALENGFVGKVSTNIKVNYPNFDIVLNTADLDNGLNSIKERNYLS